MTQRAELLGLPFGKLSSCLEEHVDARFRVKQVYNSLYARSVASFAEMTDLNAPQRSRLAEVFSIHRPVVEARDEAADGTVKYSLRVSDDTSVEAVDIPMGDRRTLCISSQVGCALACRFCVTGFWGAGRNLSSAEILGQVLALTPLKLPPGERRFNIVFMGMGEPLLNLPALADSVEILFDFMSPKRVMVSTAGVIPGIRELATWRRRPRLAISLHAPDDERRSALMPINRRYPLDQLMAALREFPVDKGEWISVEYILIDELNDSPSDASRLARLLEGVPAMVNLIPLNRDSVLDPRLKTSSAERVAEFAERLRRAGRRCTIRRQKGNEVSAACGQLRVPGKLPRGF